MAAYPLTFQVHDWSVSLWFPTGFKISAVDTDPVKPVQDLCCVGQELVVLNADFLEKKRRKKKTEYECSLYPEQWDLFTPLPRIKCFLPRNTTRTVNDGNINYGTPILYNVNIFHYMRCILHYLQCLLYYKQCFSHNALLYVAVRSDKGRQNVITRRGADRGSIPSTQSSAWGSSSVCLW